MTVDAQYCRDEAPEKVMRTAVAWAKDVVFTLPFNVSGGLSYVVLLWFAETDAEAAASKTTREFQVGIDGNWQEPIDVAATVAGLNRGYEWGYASVTLTDASAIAFRATNRSELGPILNGLEVYAVSDPVQPRTDAQDGIPETLVDIVFEIALTFLV